MIFASHLDKKAKMKIMTSAFPFRYGDMRRLIGFAIRDMWYKLGKLEYMKAGMVLLWFWWRPFLMGCSILLKLFLLHLSCVMKYLAPYLQNMCLNVWQITTQKFLHMEYCSILLRTGTRRQTENSRKRTKQRSFIDSKRHYDRLIDY